VVNESVVGAEPVEIRLATVINERLGEPYLVS